MNAVKFIRTQQEIYGKLLIIKLNITISELTAAKNAYKNFEKSFINFESHQTQTEFQDVHRKPNYIIYMKVALFLTGKFGSTNINITNIMKNVIIPNNCDVFFYTFEDYYINNFSEIDILNNFTPLHI